MDICWNWILYFADPQVEVIGYPGEVTKIVAGVWSRIFGWWQERDILQKIHGEYEHFVPGKYLSCKENIIALIWKLLRLTHAVTTSNSKWKQPFMLYKPGVWKFEYVFLMRLCLEIQILTFLPHSKSDPDQRRWGLGHILGLS